MADTTKQRVGFWQRLAQLLGLARRKEKLPYELQPTVLTAAEQSFYQVMKPLVGSSVTVCPKVRLTDVFSLPKDIKGRQALWNRISQKHVDFVLCDAATMKPLFAVELDDSSHKFEKAKARDEFVNRVFADASLPLLRFPAKRGYKTAEIAAQLAPYVTGQPVAASPIEPIVSVPVSSAEPCCPKCGKLMVIRTANKGAHAGEQFYACSGYPQCKTTLPLSQATVLQQ